MYYKRNRVSPKHTIVTQLSTINPSQEDEVMEVPRSVTTNIVISFNGGAELGGCIKKIINNSLNNILTFRPIASIIINGISSYPEVKILPGESLTLLLIDADSYIIINRVIKTYFITDESTDSKTKTLINSSYGSYRKGDQVYFPNMTGGAKRFIKLSDSSTGDWDIITPTLLV